MSCTEKTFIVSSQIHNQSKWDCQTTCITFLYYGGVKMITLRLDPNLEQAVTNTAKKFGLTKSDLI
ncbi:hypothetical protein GMMP1_1570005 [Candidatus Magnetomoraceae bacterium gMMP-1]